MPLRRTVRKLSSNLSIDTPILVAAKAGLDSTVAAASARSRRFMSSVPPVAALCDERFLLVARTTKECGLLVLNPNLLARIWLAYELADVGEMDCVGAKSSWPTRRLCGPRVYPR